MGLPVFTLQDIADRAQTGDLVCAIRGRVFDLTNFEHPGGFAVLRMYSGKDATAAFESMHDEKILEAYGKPLQIGVLAGHETAQNAPGSPTSAGNSPGNSPSSNPAAQETSVMDFGGLKVNGRLVNQPHNGISDADHAHQDVGVWAAGGGNFHHDDVSQTATEEYWEQYPPERPPPDVETKEITVQAPGLGRKGLDICNDMFWRTAGLSTAAIYKLAFAPMEWLSRKVAPVTGFPKNKDGSPTKVAIIGAGCSGLSAAWTLNRTDGFDIQIYESQPQIGGHSFSYAYTGEDGKQVAIDMGFIFAHHRSYLNLVQMLEAADAKYVDTELSLNVDINGKQWATNQEINGRPIPEPDMPKGLRAECDRFHALADRFWDNSAFNAMPFGWVLKMYGFSEEWKEVVMTPTLITLFISAQGLYSMSARFMFNMFAGHNKFVDLRTAWRCFTIQKGTFHLWSKICQEFVEKIRCNAPVREVRRIRNSADGKEQVLVITDTDTQVYDHVLMACSGTVAGQILSGQSATEKLTFGMIKYEGERVVLHTDSSFLPEKNIRNFNYKTRPGFELPELTGVMTQVSNQEPPHPIPLGTMNPMREPKGILKERYCAVHVQGFKWLVMSRVFLPMIQGKGNVWYGASWCNWLGHSGGIDAGMAAACRIGGRYQLKDEVGIREYFDVTCQDMFGPRFDPHRSVREARPIVRASL
jgi:uncharacterized protein